MSTPYRPDAADVATAADALDLARRIEQGRIDGAVVRWLSAGFEKFFRNGGTVALGRCLGLELTPRQLRLKCRDQWLVEAATWVSSANSSNHAAALAAEYDRFLTRGEWRQWRALAHPPQGASGLRRCLFFAAKAEEAGEVGSIVESLSSKQIGRIFGHRFSKRCPEISMNMEPHTLKETR